MLDINQDKPNGRREYEIWRLQELDKVRPLVMETMEFERRLLELVVELCQGDKSEAARRLGIGRNTLYRKLQYVPQSEPSTLYCGRGMIRV